MRGRRLVGPKLEPTDAPAWHAASPDSDLLASCPYTFYDSRVLRLCSSTLAGMLLVVIAMIAAGWSMPAASQQAPSGTTVPQTAPTPDPEVTMLRAQVDEMRRSGDRLLQVIVGALSVLALINIAGYVISNRNYDRDRGRCVKNYSAR